MRQFRRFASQFLVLGVFAAGNAAIAQAQTVNGVLGEPGATITLDGKQLPPLPPAFGGVIKEKATESDKFDRPL